MKKQKQFIGVLISTLLFGSLNAQEVYVGTQIRPRAEFRNGYRTLVPEKSLPIDTIKPSIFVSQRSRVWLRVKDEKNKFEAKVSIQDVRVWGETPQLGDVASLALHEAWLKIWLSPKVIIKTGRQELAYDDQRLLGSVNWTQMARQHDALLIQLRPQFAKIDLGFAYNNSSPSIWGTLYRIPGYKALAFIWIHKSINDVKVSLYGISDGFETPLGKVIFRYTTGPHISFKHDNIFGTLSYYHQLGTTTSGQNINAFLASVQIGLKIAKLTLSIGSDYLSGDDARDTTRFNSELRTFHTLYATNHKFYGHMDYFLNIPVDTRRGGLHDSYLKISYKFSEKFSSYLHGHYFLLPGAVATSSGFVSGPLGTEADLGITYKISQALTLKSGYSLMLPTKTMEAIKGGIAVPGHWVWIMINLKPEYLVWSRQ
ncbi:MAG: alginate export family protein [Chlorobi bacterium]|nr:alginate export family protein [Chlorobiota bacterium]